MVNLKERAKHLYEHIDIINIDIPVEKEFVEEIIQLLQELIDAPEPEPMQALTDTDIARIYRNIFGGNRWPSDCYPEFARAIESAALGAAQQPEPPADLVRDAERYRWLRKKLCFSGNGDGTASMHAINLPNAAKFPEHDKLEIGADAAIDAAIERDKLKGQP